MPEAFSYDAGFAKYTIPDELPYTERPPLLCPRKNGWSIMPLALIERFASFGESVGNSYVRIAAEGQPAQEAKTMPDSRVLAFSFRNQFLSEPVWLTDRKSEHV